MKTKRILLFALVLSLLPIAPAIAVENGTDASGNPFVVPIMTRKTPLLQGGCSGALIAPLIVVTAAHCVLDANGILTTEVFVGEAGGDASTAGNQSNQVKTIQITSSFINGANGTVGDNDLAFLTMSKPIVLSTPVSLASESELISLRDSSAPLKIIGYGSQHDNSASTSSTPNSFQGKFVPIANTLYPNTADMTSIVGDACKGDSGSPVLSITASKVTLVGIVTGGALNVNCTKKQNDGSYYTLFTLVGRYANLAFAATVDSMNSQQDQSTKATGDAQTQIEDLISQVNEVTQNNFDLTTSLEEASQQIKDLTKKYTACIASAKKILSTKKGKLPVGC